MNTSKLADIAEITSSIAILVTLVFLVVQMQQNTAAVQSAGRQATLTTAVELLYKFSDNPYLVLGRFDGTLSDEEKVQLGSIMLAFFRQREHDWLEYQNDALDAAAWESYRRTTIVFLSAPMVRTWWGNASQDLFDPVFVEQVNVIIANQPVLTRPPQLAWFDG